MTPNPLDTIPQEKFDNFNKALERSQSKASVKNIKVAYIDIENFKNIEGISTELSDINIIGWYNGNWKSSFVEAILTAIQSNKMYGKWAVSPASLVKKWENSATIRILLKGEEQEIVVQRIFTTGTKSKPEGKVELEASIDGHKITQADLDALLNTMTLDPLKISTLSDAEQIKMIKETVWLDTSELDREIMLAEEERKLEKKWRDDRKSIYESFTKSGVPKKVEIVDAEKILRAQREYQELATKKATLQNKRVQLEEVDMDIETAKKRLAELEAKKESITASGKELAAEIKTIKASLDEKYVSEEELELQLASINETNANARKFEEYEKAKKLYNEAEESVEQTEKEVAALRSKRTKAIAESNLPKYMEIDEVRGILVDGQPYKLLNTARKIEVWIDLVMISWSPLRMIRIENGGELDVKTIQAITPKILENNFQIFLERPVIDKFDSIIISDGELLEGKAKEDFISKQ